MPPIGTSVNEQATRETIEPDGWLHTGDVASMDEDGCVLIVDPVRECKKHRLRPETLLYSNRRLEIPLS